MHCIFALKMSLLDLLDEKNFVHNFFIFDYPVSIFSVDISLFRFYKAILLYQV